MKVNKNTFDGIEYALTQINLILNERIEKNEKELEEVRGTAADKTVESLEHLIASDKARLVQNRIAIRDFYRWTRKE